MTVLSIEAETTMDGEGDAFCSMFRSSGKVCLRPFQRLKNVALEEVTQA
jgi:hypothetical protein